MACLPLKVVQSPELRAPRFVAEAVGTLSVMTGVLVPVATEELRSDPLVLVSVRAATLVTDPAPAPLAAVPNWPVVVSITTVWVVPRPEAPATPAM